MSTLLEQASLVMIPSGYKEDVVYSQIPTSGAGDLSFTRASNGTRINSAGLVEVVAWNELQQSEALNTTWSDFGTGVTVTANATTAPNGTGTADLLAFPASVGSAQYVLGQIVNLTAGVPYTFSFWAKAVSGTITNLVVRINGTEVALGETITTEWQRFTKTLTPATASDDTGFKNRSAVSGSGTAINVYIWGAQLNIGATAKPYFPTTDRLNVPRLTYQNGGGGCPSLLLEKQSTNILTYSEDFSNAAWAKLDSGSGSTTPVVTANYAISPDGTQNADRLQCTLGSSGYSLIQQSPTVSGTHTGSIWVKSNTGANQNVYFRVSANSTAYVVTPEWQRINITEANGDYLTIGLRDQTGYTNYSCDILIWGAQLEASSYATSYIVSTSSSATRVADACFKTGISSLIGQTEGVIFYDGVLTGISNPYANLINSEKNVTGSFSIGQRISTGAILCGFFVGGSGVMSFDAGSYALGTRTKIAFAYKSGSFALYVNGTQLATSSATFTPVENIDDIYIGDETTFFNYKENTQVNQVALFKTRLTNAELASLTTI